MRSFGTSVTFPLLEEPTAANAYHFILMAQHKPKLYVRRWGKGWRMTRDAVLAHQFDEKTAPTGRSAAQKARHQRQVVEKSVNVPLQVVWVRSAAEKKRRAALVKRLEAGLWLV
jgi:hypothetical protein